jgi:hypothetical protein
MFSLSIGKFHIWEGNNAILMSDEKVKKLRSFNSFDDCINWLFLNDEQHTARSLSRSRAWYKTEVMS